MIKRLFAALARLLAVVALAGAIRPWVQRADRELEEALAPPREERPLRPGWGRPKPETSPRPTYWPVLLALGIMLLCWGIISNIIVFGAGLLLLLWSVAGWIGDLLDEG